MRMIRLVHGERREVTAGLESLLGQLVAAPGRWIFIIEDARTPVHYIQFLCYEDGSLLAEVTSNIFLDQLQDTRHRWDEPQKELAGLGWQPPAPTWKPNWTDIWPVFSPPVDVVAARARRTLAEVFGLSGDDAVVVKMFSSPNRGGTPASEVVGRELERDVRTTQSCLPAAQEVKSLRRTTTDSSHWTSTS
jgi:hypothetical protein